MAETTSLGYTVHVLISVSPDGVTDEATREVGTWDEAMAAVDEAVHALPEWRAITVYRTEEQPRFLMGAERREADRG